MNSNGRKPGNTRPKVLIIDDEPGLAEVLGYILGEEYDVTVHTSGSRGLEILRAEDSKVDVVICYLMVPDLTGIELYDNLEKIGNGMEKRVIFLTGGIIYKSFKEFLDRIPNPCLSRPFNIVEIRSEIRNILDKKYEN